ncbi:transcriptional regulator, TetR family [Klenkia soli]|uniref:Transcriptional regulator, TetR family n=1 Tax=Klenkia soli TaxID=1052260 RepID=A0A1H0P1E3_9ACTN|nr:TetR family transcriptional regulator [Klenkia soli]SDO98771.1 transcriptional regulator, TetR family [Klenkia soli]
MPEQARHAMRKARTRVEVRRAAQRLFAERPFDEVTVADIAAAAEVAVQTVFNHFATKEDLYFADRVPWVAGPATAVTDRSPGTGAMTTATAWLVHHVSSVPLLLRRPSYRTYLETILASPALRVHQRELLREAEDRLTTALHRTWAAELGDVPGLRLGAGMTSGLLVAGARVVLDEQWRQLSGVPDGARELPQLIAELRAASRVAIECVHGGFPQAADRAGGSEALRAILRLEEGRPADERAARTTRPRMTRERQESETTGSSTVSTRSATSASVIGTAKAV